MDVSLNADLERRIRERVASGDYASVGAFVQDAVERLIADEGADLDALRARLAQAEAEVERGEFIEIDTDEAADALARDIHERGLKGLAEYRKTGTDG